MNRLLLTASISALAGACFAYGSPTNGSGHANARHAGGRVVINYATDIAPIFNAHCVSCHRPGQVAPFSLIGYESSKKWASMAAAVTASKQMPPWKAVEGYGEFKNANLLTATEIQSIEAWANSGCPRGDKKKEPKLNLPSVGEWVNGKPDMILQASKSFSLGAEGADVYRNFVFDLHNSQPLWVTAIEAQPENKRTVHHIIAFLDERGVAKKLERMETDGQIGYTSSGGGAGFLPDGSLGGWAPGVTPNNAPPGMGFLVKPNTTIVMQVHYHPSGKPEQDRTRLGIYLSKVPVTQKIDLEWLFNFGLNIPPGEKQYKISRTITFREPITIYTVMPHMHLLGRKMKSWLEFPDGTVKPLIQVDDWDFNWQLVYRLKDPIHIPAGTKQVLEAVYDNSPDNPRNPSNPPKRVTWGEQTTDEMCLLIEAYTADKQLSTVSLRNP